MELAEKIKELCEQKGMTAKELSEKSDIPLTTVKRIMSGQTPDPGYTTVIKIFKVLEIPESVVFEVAPKNRLIEVYERMIAHKNRWLKILAIALAAIVGTILVFLAFDLLNGKIGNIRY